LTPLADVGRSGGQAPLHRVRAAGIGAPGDDAKIAAPASAAVSSWA
jgi:hypothetical protein